MKILKSKSADAASTLLVVVMFTGILTLALASYLALTSNENQSVLRSRSWNAAMPLAEAGIEEAMSQIQINAEDYLADGWTSSGANLYTKRRNLGSDYYIVSISGTATNGLTLSSTGFVQSVSITDHGKYNSVDNSYASRAVQVTAKLSLFPMPVGIVAKTKLGFGGNLGVNSYDTQTLAGSSTNTGTVGMYDSTRKSALAFVGCISSAPLSLGGNEHIYGYAASGVGALTPDANGSASIGDFTQLKGVQPGYATNNYYVPMPDVVAPYSSANPPTPVPTNTFHGQTCNYILSGGNYMISSLTSKYLYVANNSVLYVTGDAAAGRITFATTGTNVAKLDLYVGGTSLPVIPLYNELTNSAGTFILSQAVAPGQLKLLGMNSCTNLSMSGNSDLVGCIYAPHVNFKAQGNANVYGSFAVDTFHCSGTFNFHYDLALTNAVSKTALRILSWAEL